MVNAGWQPADAADAFERGEEAAVLERWDGVRVRVQDLKRVLSL